MQWRRRWKYSVSCCYFQYFLFPFFFSIFSFCLLFSFFFFLFVRLSVTRCVSRSWLVFAARHALLLLSSIFVSNAVGVAGSLRLEFTPLAVSGCYAEAEIHFFFFFFFFLWHRVRPFRLMHFPHIYSRDIPYVCAHTVHADSGSQPASIVTPQSTMKTFVCLSAATAAAPGTTQKKNLVRRKEKPLIYSRCRVGGFRQAFVYGLPYVSSPTVVEEPFPLPTPFPLVLWLQQDTSNSIWIKVIKLSIVEKED